MTATTTSMGEFPSVLLSCTDALAAPTVTTAIAAEPSSIAVTPSIPLSLPAPAPAPSTPSHDEERHCTRLKNPLVKDTVGVRELWDPSTLDSPAGGSNASTASKSTIKKESGKATASDNGATGKGKGVVGVSLEDDDDQLMADSYPSPASLPLPSFITSTSFSSSDSSNSSSDSDSSGDPKPAKAPRRKNKPRPKYYYDEHYDPANPDGKKKRGRRGGFKGVPVFEPTMDDFHEGGFYEYVKKIEKYGMRSGIVKVVPPKEWIDSLPSTIAPLATIRLREPIEQHILGSQGLYRVTNVAKTRIWNPAQWKKMSEEKKWESPDWKGEKEGRQKRGDASTSAPTRRRVDKGKGKEKEEQEDGGEAEGEEEEPQEEESAGPSIRLTRAAAQAAEVAERELNKPKKRGRRPSALKAKVAPVKLSPVKGKRKRVEEDDEVDLGAEADLDEESDPALPRPSPPPSSQDVEMTSTTTPSIPPIIPGSPTSLTGTVIPPTPTQPSAPTSVKKKRPTVLQRAEPTEEEWQEFMGTFDQLPHGLTKEDYTIEMMREVERRYWRTLTFGEPPMYGADMAGSLYDDSTKGWNVAHLGDLLPKLAPASCKIPGVVSPYLYFGMWRATFAWHVEDADLYSINYIHFGAPKFWYSVPQESSNRFERVMEGFFPTDRSKCPEFLRHKAFLASPRVLANSGIVINRCMQLPGEFILTYPKGYHSGFNLGFNCAESINFATERWLPLGKVAKACTCIGDSVSIDVEGWLNDASRAEALARGDIFEDGTSTRKRPLAPTPAPSHPTLSEKSSMEPMQKKKKLEPAFVEKSAELLKKAKVEQDKIAKVDGWPCALCPDTSEEGLVRIGEPGVKSKKALTAHRVCVLFTPATWIDNDVNGEEIVRGYAGIEKARWKLKCQLCSEKHGTKVQCTKGKCPKAFHVTCALRDDSGVFLEATAMAKDGTSSSLLDQARAELDDLREAVKIGSPKTPSRVAIPHRSVALPEPPIALKTSATTPTTPPTSNGALPAEPIAIVPAPSEVAIDDGGIKLTILCRTHNPEWQKTENVRKVAELQARVDKLALQSRVRVKTSGGVFEVTFSQSHPAREAIAIVFDDGKRSEVKWRNIVWPDSPEVARKKEQAAEKARANHVYVWENRPIAPTKRSSYGTPSVSNAGPSYTPYAHAAPPPASYGAYPPYTPYGPPQGYGYSYPPPPHMAMAGNAHYAPSMMPPVRPPQAMAPAVHPPQSPWTSSAPTTYAPAHNAPASYAPPSLPPIHHYQPHGLAFSSYHRPPLPPSSYERHAPPPPRPHPSHSAVQPGLPRLQFAGSMGSPMFRNMAPANDTRVPSPALSTASSHSHHSDSHPSAPERLPSIATMLGRPRDSFIVSRGSASVDEGQKVHSVRYQ